MKQGGVLFPANITPSRSLYELNDEPSAYGDLRPYLWHLVPIAEGKICTHA